MTFQFSKFERIDLVEMALLLHTLFGKFLYRGGWVENSGRLRSYLKKFVGGVHIPAHLVAKLREVVPDATRGTVVDSVSFSQ